MLAGALLYAAPLAAQGADRTLDPDPAVRVLAYRAVGDRQDPGDLALLAERLASESDPTARLAAQDAMGRLLLGFDELARALDQSPSPQARAWAAHALGNYPGVAAVQALLRAVDDPDERVRREVYEALGRQADPLALDALMRAAVRDPAAELRRVADRAAHAVAAGRQDTVDVPTSLALLASGDTSEKVVAAQQLGRSGDWRVYEPLVHAATSGRDEVRQTAVSALGVLGDRRAVPLLHGFVEGEDGAVRYNAIAALAHLADESSRPVLARLVTDPDPLARRFAVRALGWLGGPGTASLVAPGLDDTDQAVRAEVVQQLRDLDGDDRLPVVVRACDDPEPFIRAEAVRLLAQLDGEAVVPRLLQALEDSDPLVRLTATDGLVSRGAPEAIGPLTRLRDRTRSTEERQLYEQALLSLGGSPQ